MLHREEVEVVGLKIFRSCKDEERVGKGFIKVALSSFYRISKCHLLGSDQFELTAIIHYFISINNSMPKYNVLGRTSLQSQSYLMTDGQSACLSWYQATIWEPRPIFFVLAYGICLQTVAVLFSLLRDAPSDERLCLSFSQLKTVVVSPFSVRT
jgi:hypothetical protein